MCLSGCAADTCVVCADMCSTGGNDRVACGDLGACPAVALNQTCLAGGQLLLRVRLEPRTMLMLPLCKVCDMTCAFHTRFEPKTMLMLPVCNLCDIKCAVCITFEPETMLALPSYKGCDL